MEIVDLASRDSDGDNDDSLDSKEAHVLREAGITPILRKGRGRRETSHIVFVDNEEQGLCGYYSRDDDLFNRFFSAETCE